MNMRKNRMTLKTYWSEDIIFASLDSHGAIAVTMSSLLSVERISEKKCMPLIFWSFIDRWKFSIKSRDRIFSFLEIRSGNTNRNLLGWPLICLCLEVFVSENRSHCNSCHLDVKPVQSSKMVNKPSSVLKTVHFLAPFYCIYSKQIRY